MSSPEKMQRIFSDTTFEKREQERLEYWWSKTPEERMNALEEIRKQSYPDGQTPRDFREFLDGLNARSVKYLVVGGYAVTLYGYPRHTGDIDIWVQREPGNAAALVAAIKQYRSSTPRPRLMAHLRVPRLPLANET